MGILFRGLKTMDETAKKSRKTLGTQPVFKQAERVYNTLMQCGDKSRQATILKMITETVNEN